MSECPSCGWVRGLPLPLPIETCNNPDCRTVVYSTDD